MKKYNVIDLFCGCGGFSKGFENAGFSIKLGIDSWKDATITYKHNFRNAKVINDDIINTSADKILHILNLNYDEVDVIIGGPPCQGFSISGKRMLDDPRNRLYKSFVDIVGTIKPKVFVMENVPGLIRLFDGKVKEEVIKDFTEIGFNVEMRLLVADDYGVPQRRKRVFFVGINKDKIRNTDKFVFPIQTLSDEQKVTCKQAISDLDFLLDDVIGENEIDYLKPCETSYQKLMRQSCNKLLNHVITLHKEKTRDIISLVPDGGNYKSLPVPGRPEPQSPDASNMLLHKSPAVLPSSPLKHCAMTRELRPF